MKYLVRPIMVGAMCLAGATLSPSQSGLTAKAHAQTAARTAGGEAELTFWKSVADSKDRAQFDAYLTAFPQGLFADLARAKIAALVPAAMPQPAPQAAPLPASNPAPSVRTANIAAVPAVLTNVALRQTAPASGLAKLEPAFVAQLRMLGLSQGNRHRLGPVSLPPRPQFSAAAAIDIPPRFCSAEERNAFHDARFRPAVDQASKKNADAIAHMELLKRLSDEATARGDSNTAIALSSEAMAYEGVARSVYLERTAMDSAFPRLMAVPIVACSGAKQ